MITQGVRDYAAEQNSDSYLAGVGVRRETPPEARGNAEEGMEEMSRRYKEKGERLYLPEEEVD
ncbi:hypothetical protein GCM10011371_19160 [Novosphingobium marinum]|nr:hypothetical protein GCM10011371_19160 [Novosphingobium marinum]